MSEFKDETREIVLTVPDTIPAREFDNATHLLDYMKKVDVIIDEPDKYLYIEFKNRNNSADATDSELYEKVRDTFLYEYFFGRAEKDIFYYVIFAGRRLDKALLTIRTDELRKRVPVKGVGPPQIPWSNPFVTKCVCHSVETWNIELARYPVRIERQ